MDSEYIHLGRCCCFCCGNDGIDEMADQFRMTWDLILLLLIPQPTLVTAVHIDLVDETNDVHINGRVDVSNCNTVMVMVRTRHKQYKVSKDQRGYR
jgi:hypothetical protein